MRRAAIRPFPSRRYPEPPHGQCVFRSGGARPPTDANGYGRTADPVYTQNGGDEAGVITSSDGFANGRGTSPVAPELSFYRNRYYNQGTGRFTQEDPIGIAGGLNLYQYAGNNPAMFTDPFGLCPAQDTNTADCDDSNLGNVWKLLDESEAGRAVISDYVSAGASVTVGSCGTGSAEAARLATIAKK